MNPNSLTPALYITGLGSQYPPYLLGPEDLEKLAARFHDVSRPGIKKLLQVNSSTGIETRSAIRPYEVGFATQKDPPSISEIDQFFRQAGVDLAVEACKKALKEACVTPQQITHTIGVTCTNQGNPGYDFLVAQKLNLPSNVDRMLLHGVGCAGGLSILRAAAQIAGGASVRRKPARILAFACELCTPNVRRYLSLAEIRPDSDQVNIAAALFSDAAAAFVLCNEYAMAQDEQVTPQYELLEWGYDLIPDTAEHMTFYADIDGLSVVMRPYKKYSRLIIYTDFWCRVYIGYRATLDRDIPKYTKYAIGPMFEKLLPSYEEQIQSQLTTGGQLLRSLGIGDFDWALHPGGKAIIDGIAQVLQLSEDQLHPRVTHAISGPRLQEDVTARSSADHAEEQEPLIVDQEVFDQEPRTAWIIRKLLKTWSDTRDFIRSEQGVGIFKCSLAYLLASLAVFTPIIGNTLGHQNGKHMVATITVYFHPARSQGSMYKALICAFVAFIFAAVLSLSSMWITILFHEKYDMIELGHVVVLVVFVAGGFGCIGWFKQKMDDPLVNIACSLASLASILVIMREGAVQNGALSFDKISQVLRMVILGVGIAAAVSLSILPSSARKKFRGNLSTLTTTAMSMLITITESFINGSTQDLQEVPFTKVSARHDKAFGELKNQLNESKFEHYVAGTEREYSVAKRLVNLMQEITRRLGALRGAVALESILLRKDTRLNHSEAKVFENFKSRLETSMVRDNGPRQTPHMVWSNDLKNILVSTLTIIFQEVSFGPAPDYKIFVDSEARPHIDEAIKAYRDARIVALHSLSSKEIMISLTEENNACFEEIFASCNYYSASLLELVEQMQHFLLALEEMQAENDERPNNRSWAWIWVSWWQADHRRQRPQWTETSTENHPRGQSNDTILTGAINSEHFELQYPGQHSYSRTHYYRWRYLGFFRADEVKFALKVGIGAAIYALPAFISWTRPFYLFWRGEWGLLSYMLVCSMTIGASNTTGFARFIGTCLGALCSIAAWYLVGERAIGLAMLGFFMALGPFYMIIVKGQGPMGRFILLTYNLSVLYAYSYSQTNSDKQDRSGEHLNITEIVLHRVTSVTSGCIWGIIITRGIWPIRAWTKLNNTLHLLWLRLQFIWESDPLSTIAIAEANTPAWFMNPQDRFEIERLFSQLERLRTSARSEFELKRPFPDAAYGNIIRRTRRIVDNLYSLDLILVNAPGLSEGQCSLLRYTAVVRQRLSIYICHLLAVIASSVERERAYRGTLTNIGAIQDELLGQIYHFRQERIISHSTDDVDYVLLHSFILVTHQLSNDILEITVELDRIYPALDDQGFPHV
ncbi:hypothetical protein N7463_002305 [Penicillium fimorum]|uniref:Uncharacterized protein n=1 Tax=Penicillium fimorum TaxID=1882269 RepID=A0A9W9XYW8_9EURO|nr:hypothetical protein N7463_002305 [Penicillium fimorum]